LVGVVFGFCDSCGDGFSDTRFCIRGQAEATITPDLNGVIVKTKKIACMIVCFISSAIA
jgi:hypothetical protein